MPFMGLRKFHYVPSLLSVFMSIKIMIYVYILVMGHTDQFYDDKSHFIFLG